MASLKKGTFMNLLMIFIANVPEIICINVYNPIAFWFQIILKRIKSIFINLFQRITI